MNLKNWFKIFKGEQVGSSDQIRAEIGEIERQIQEIQGRAAALRDELKAAGIEKLAGADPGEKITLLESEIRTLEWDNDLLLEVKQILSEKRSEAIAKEKAERVKEIAKEIEQIRSDKSSIQEEACSLAAHLAALLYRAQGTHMHEVKNLLTMDHSRGIQFRAEVEKILDGQIPFRDQERLLMNERKELIG